MGQDNLLVRDVTNAWRQTPSVVRVGEPLSRAVEELLAHPMGRGVYVLDAEGKLRGVVSYRSLLKAFEARHAGPAAGWGFFGAWKELLADRVDQLMREPTTLLPETPLAEAVRLMRERHENDLPIVDEEGRLVGELNALQVMRAALDAFRGSEAKVAEARRPPRA